MNKRKREKEINLQQNQTKSILIDLTNSNNEVKNKSLQDQQITNSNYSSSTSLVDASKNKFSEDKSISKKNIMKINSILNTETPKNEKSYFQQPLVKKVKFTDENQRKPEYKSFSVASISNFNSNNSSDPSLNKIINIVKIVQQESHKIVESTESVLKDYRSNSLNNSNFRINDQSYFLQNQAAILKRKVEELEKELEKESIKSKWFNSCIPQPINSAILEFENLGDKSENSDHYN